MTLVIVAEHFGPSGRMLRLATQHYARDIPAYVIARAKGRRRRLRCRDWMWLPRSLPCITKAPARLADVAWLDSMDRFRAQARKPHLRRPMARAA